ncbi:hypothetical protein EVJ58_g1803 [Rhodofomes roseus]|uniref:C2H2-type domain-containing protein n=1 Tax=Rhodofomes roseus TaxID=34475 RepID=A0A4Y9YXT0_9APHY|nr:hypothetical protein EVJ58_g1803 [Rhodofomes roseus]
MYNFTTPSQLYIPLDHTRQATRNAAASRPHNPPVVQWPSMPPGLSTAVTQDFIAPFGHMPAGPAAATSMSASNGGNVNYQGLGGVWMSPTAQYNGDPQALAPWSPAVQAPPYDPVQERATGLYTTFITQAPHALPADGYAVDPALELEAAVAAALCFYGGPCFHLSQDDVDKKMRGLRHHLKQCHAHQFNVGRRAGSTRIICQWAADGQPPCKVDVQDMYYLAKHIWTKHLKGMQVECDVCGDVLSQKFALNRHKNRHHSK